MKKTSLFFYFVLLVVSLVLAWFSWVAAPKPAEEGVAIINCKKGELQGLTLEEERRSATYTFRKSAYSGESYWWVESLQTPISAQADKPEEERTSEEASGEVKPVVKGFKGNDKLEEALKGFCPWQSMRTLGKLDKEKRTLFGLNKEDTVGHLSLKLNTGPQVFRLGQAAFGFKDRYIENEKSGDIYLVDGKPLEELLFPKTRFMQRNLHDFQDKDLARIKVVISNRETELIYQSSDEDGSKQGWADSRRPEQVKTIYTNWIRKLFTLRISDYLPPTAGAPGCTPPADSETLVRLSFYTAKKEIGFLTIYKAMDEKGAAAYSACSEKTEGLVTLPTTLIETIINDMKDLFD